MKQRLHAVIRGAVQGVGFRPFVFRLAQELDLTGWVMNSAQGVFLEVEGPPDRLQVFQIRLHSEHPPRASIQSCETTILDASGFSLFEIRASGQTGPKTALVLPDIALCDDCKRELWDPSNRRYRYPFINCTNCGPRFSIIERLPYDRPNTTMRGFAMCPACRHEYENPADRRFHAQPNACPACGPGIQLWDDQGKTIAENDAAALATVEAIRDGAIVAVKGIGGFHLFAHAGNLKTVRLLRQRKQREEKPLALMVPSLDVARQLCRISPLEERLLTSPESPIVLLRSRDDADSSLICDEVAPHNPMLGIMLPYAPLHHILLHDAGIPLIATSGNLSDEPICIDEKESLVRLKGIADRFLVHNRPIHRHVDDSIARILLDRELVLRRARGYAPLPVSLPAEVPDLLAVGAHLKNTVALSRGNLIFISQHLGDLETPEAFGAFQKETAQLQELFEGNPAAVVSDLHPDYLSTSFARQRPERVVAIQHHIAHVASCMAENALTDPVLGVAWDGTGLGTDGTVWGGEWFAAVDGSFTRVAHLRTFPLPGGDQAVREPRRSALGLLYVMLGNHAFTLTGLPPVAAWTQDERSTLQQMLEQGINAPLTSSIGRLFDAVSALLGLRMQNRFEGQAAMELEWAAAGWQAARSPAPGSEKSGEGHGVQGTPIVPADSRRPEGRSEDPTASTYAFAVEGAAGQERPILVDWEPMIKALVEDVRTGKPVPQIAYKFHATLAAIIVNVAERIGIERVALSGGCFQNALLTELTVHALRARGFRPYWHQRVPPNDGGISLGQIAAAARMLRPI